MSSIVIFRAGSARGPVAGVRSTARPLADEAWHHPELRRAGGRVRSAKKAAAARRSGLEGGRSPKDDSG